VGRINAQANTIALGTRDEISFRTVRANKINTLLPEELVAGRSVYGKIRSYGDPRLCRIIDAGETIITVEFDEPQFAPCPGQSLVLYNNDDNIIAGGTII
jgi:tRNA-specific 2-thiouridylase